MLKSPKSVNEIIVYNWMKLEVLGVGECCVNSYVLSQQQKSEKLAFEGHNCLKVRELRGGHIFSRDLLYMQGPRDDETDFHRGIRSGLFDAGG